MPCHIHLKSLNHENIYCLSLARLKENYYSLIVIVVMNASNNKRDDDDAGGFALLHDERIGRQGE
jgi:hypothetical protein